MVRPPNLMRAFDPPPVTVWRRSERPAASTTATLGPVEPGPLGPRWTPTSSAGPGTLGSAPPVASGPAGPTDGADPRISVSPDPGGDFNESGIRPFTSPKATRTEPDEGRLETVHAGHRLEVGGYRGTRNSKSIECGPL